MQQLVTNYSSVELCFICCTVLFRIYLECEQLIYVFAEWR